VSDITVRFPAWGFPTVTFNTNDGPKMHRFKLAAWDRQTDRQACSQHCLMSPYRWGIITPRVTMHG